MNWFEIRAYAREFLVIAGLVIIAVAAACVLSLVLSTTKADAQEAPKCVPLADMRQVLLKDYGEVELSGGMMGEQALMIIFATPDGSSWTAIFLGTNGQACPVAGGQNWVAIGMQTKESF